ncbi:hypothetical protein Acor_51840 [Acrocarpospora corrugata]|uniref:Ricin B lectin domain-containing protein n=1 Tax=Acrocarpospora corrugata TaxID=35763 RepID=A0A5M3W9E1_9ACTN|nr:hypothetical protein [Acrocarpospora corrugata]GES03118.1 hypothetical protein Acor_51840 [Acrocarpospora corrugata]
MSLGKKTLAGIALAVAAVATVGVASTPAHAAFCKGTYTIQAANGYYVQTDEDHPSYPGMIRAISTGVGNWEKFRIYEHGTSGAWSTSIQALNGKYVTVGTVGGNSGVLRASATSNSSVNTMFSWPSGRPGPRSDDSWEWFRSNSASRYVANEEGFTGDNWDMLRARSTSVGTWENFHFRRIGGC